MIDYDDLVRRLRTHEDWCAVRLEDEFGGGECDCGGTVRLEAADTIIRLEADNAALRKDAERLDWLLPKIRGAQYRDIGVFYGSGDDIRSAIDAAMLTGKDGK